MQVSCANKELSLSMKHLQLNTPSQLLNIHQILFYLMELLLKLKDNLCRVTDQNISLLKSNTLISIYDLCLVTQEQESERKAKQLMPCGVIGLVLIFLMSLFLLHGLESQNNNNESKL